MKREAGKQRTLTDYLEPASRAPNSDDAVRGERASEGFERAFMSCLGAVLRCRYCGAVFVSERDADRHRARPDPECQALRARQQAL